MLFKPACSLGLMEDDSEDAAVNITKIQQMYCRVKEKNTDNTYQYVPVYAFLGKISVSGTEDTNDSIFCLINAIDGTIINAEMAIHAYFLIFIVLSSCLALTFSDCIIKFTGIKNASSYL